MCDRTTHRQAPDVVSRHQIRALVAHGWTVDLLARGPMSHENVRDVRGPWLVARAIRSLERSRKRDLRGRLFGWLARRQLRRNDYDAVITWNSLGWGILPEAERSGTPCFLNCGNFPEEPWNPDARVEPRRWPGVPARRIRAEYFDSRARVLVTSEHALRRFVAAGCPEERLESIGRGFDPQLFFPAPRREHRPFRLLFCGRLEQRKGIFRVLELWRAMALDDAELWLCGAVPEENRARIESLATPSVRILDDRPDVAEVMRRCDAQILLSSNEGMAKALLEGAACGLATIATAQTGFPFELGDIGVEVDADDGEQVTAAIRGLAGDPSRLAAMSQRAARLLAERYTWEEAGKRFVAAIERGLEDGRGGRPSRGETRQAAQRVAAAREEAPRAGSLDVLP